MPIIYRINVPVPVEQVIALYRDSGLNRPVADRERIAAMYANSNVVVSAWEGEELIGVARSVTDLVYCCYLSDLAVRKTHQGAGIGRELIARTKAHVGEGTMLLLLSAPNAMSYYPHIGMQEVNNAFILHRTQ
jgi:GNAT superfamily N-acetyltransferase